MIENGRRHAYCCHQSKDQMSECRKTYGPKKLSPWRNNLKIFNEMRLGLWDEITVCLRMKGDLSSSNPNMWDHVAYRIRLKNIHMLVINGVFIQLMILHIVWLTHLNLLLHHVHVVH